MSSELILFQQNKIRDLEKAVADKDKLIAGLMEQKEQGKTVIDFKNSTAVRTLIMEFQFNNMRFNPLQFSNMISSIRSLALILGEKHIAERMQEVFLYCYKGYSLGRLEFAYYRGYGRESMNKIIQYGYGMKTVTYGDVVDLLLKAKDEAKEYFYYFCNEYDLPMEMPFPPMFMPQDMQMQG